MDVQDKQDFLAGGFNALSSTIAHVPTRIPPSTLPGSWVTSNRRVRMQCHSVSSWLSCLSC